MQELCPVYPLQGPMQLPHLPGPGDHPTRVYLVGVKQPILTTVMHTEAAAQRAIGQPKKDFYRHPSSTNASYLQTKYCQLCHPGRAPSCLGKTPPRRFCPKRCTQLVRAKLNTKYISSKVRRINFTSIEVKTRGFDLSARALGRPPWERTFVITGSILHS
jgi:hypothetical protein